MVGAIELGLAHAIVTPALPVFAGSATLAAITVTSAGDGIKYSTAAVMDGFEVLRQLIDDSEHFAGLLLVVLVAGSRAIDGQIRKRTRYEKDLREAEERFRVAQEVSPDGFNILRPVRDGEGRITDFTFLYQNPAAGRRAGNDPNTAIGRSLLDLYPTFRGSPFESRHGPRSGRSF